MARIVAYHPAGFDLFGRFRTEKTGPHRKRFNLGLYGIEPLVSSVRLLAICRETAGTGTVPRIRALQEKQRLSVDLAERLLDCWHEFLRLQIMNEAAGIPAEGCRFVDLGALSPEEQQRLRAGLEAVEQLQMIVYQTLEPA
jgi:CBS domain-containing protein